MIREAIAKVVLGKGLGEAEMEAVMGRVIDGKVQTSQVGALLTALRMKGESVDEITGAARALNARLYRFQLNNHLINLDRDDINFEEETILEVSDTGVNGTQVFNVSAATTFVVAGSGRRIARYGNRLSSRFLGTADVLERLGINLDISSSDVERCIEEVGIGLLFSPMQHGPMRSVARIRTEMGIRTIFNLISPLANPANAARHMLGVYAAGLTETIARVIRRLEGKAALVIYGEETYDELSLCGPTKVSQLKDGDIHTFDIEPEAFGLMRVDPEALKGGSINENAAIVKEILNGGKGPRRDMVLLNAGAALWAAGETDSLETGIERAADIIDAGRARQKLEDLIAFTNQCAAYDRDASIFQYGSDGEAASSY